MPCWRSREEEERAHVNLGKCNRAEERPPLIERETPSRDRSGKQIWLVSQRREDASARAKKVGILGEHAWRRYATR